MKKKGTIDSRVYESLVRQFQEDIHNGKFFYHYELNRYHILGINLVALVDHYYKITKKGQAVPMGTFDHLIISMGIQLAHIHGRENLYILSTDDRLTNILEKCKSGLTSKVVKKLKLKIAEEVIGRKFDASIYPKHINLRKATEKELRDAFGEWPMPVGRVPSVYRWKAP
ncbi:hypothetical protein ACFL2P_03235 [Candidatus Moduliflexota bacterium]